MAELTEPRVYETGVVAGRALLHDAPSMWSYSSLKDVEGCPRRYALSRADYPDLWDQHGYPRLPIPAAIRGDVVHGALEIIVKALVKTGCSSTRSAEAVTVLRELGGYTKVAEDVLAKQLARFDGNPRISSDRRDQLTRQLTDWVPQAREQIQTYLNRMELRPSAVSGPGAPPGDPAVRYPARTGDHPEKELVAESLRLKGRIDLLSVDADGAKITDFKTGAEDQAHQDQLQLYALLWSEDSLVNPVGLAVTELVAAYPSHDVVSAAPTAEQLTGLRAGVATRIEAADAAARADFPVALIGDHCGLCSVRGLCDTYWSTGTTATAEVSEETWYDLAGTVVREHGVKSFVLQEAKTNAEVLVRTPTPSYAVPMDRDIRILGARRVIDPDEEDALIAAVASVSEILVVDE
ncbi:MAG: PD-(D/E)XK nuclease family protein [Tetrasphaera sp.]|nr:PD-(D/E)XK nuclease family protein [Tetrasphaera sp.]